jgi:hypothetical protein
MLPADGRTSLQRAIDRALPIVEDRLRRYPGNGLLEYVREAFLAARVDSDGVKLSSALQGMGRAFVDSYPDLTDHALSEAVAWVEKAAAAQPQRILAPIPVLLQSFFDAARDALGCLSLEPAFSHEESVHAFTDTGVRLVTAEEVGPWFFLARAGFATDRIVGEITYGDREFFINVVIVPTTFADTTNDGFGLWEWMAAFGMPDRRASGGPAWTPAQVREAVADVGAVLAEIWPRIASADRRVIATMQAAREKRHQEWADKEFAYKHERLAAQAADAFRKRDYARVIALLEPIASRLTPAESAKLHLARKYLATSPSDT